VVVDLGAGDGLFAYRIAREHPEQFVIAIDANSRPLEKISEKIYRKPAKGGLSNLLFLQAAVEDLPSELDGLADEVTILFPWGSLLQTVMVGPQSNLENLRRICRDGALLRIHASLDFTKDKSEMERLGLSDLSLDQLDRALRDRYRSAGFEIVTSLQLNSRSAGLFETTWGRRLKQNPSRKYFEIIARALINNP